MTDKEKFRKEVEKLKSNLIHGACSSQIAMETRCKEEAYNEVLTILDTMQEEPVSKNYRERYKRIAQSEKFKKTYEGMSIGDIVPVEEQEPASEDLEKIVEEIAEPTILNAYGTKELARRLRNTICGISISEDLGEYINELSKQFPEVSFAKLSRIAVRVAKWQKEQFEKERLKHCDALTAEQAQIESDFVVNHLKNNNRTPTFIDAIEYGMRLQKEQMMAKAINVEVNVDAGGYPYIPQMELYDYDKDVPLAKAGDRYKVILIKES